MRERRHTPGPELRWAETWEFDFVAPAHGIGGWAALTLLPNQGRASYHAFLAGPGRQLVAVVDDDVPLPSSTLEVRTTGLWADHICETPDNHWTIGLEAFGVGLDDPAEMFGAQWGDQVPLGFDLEWEAVDTPTSRATHPSGGDYDQHCTVSGEVLVGAEAIDLVGTGTRAHRWGVPRCWDEASVRALGTVDGQVIDIDTTFDVAAAPVVDTQVVDLGPPLAVDDTTTIIRIVDDASTWHARPLAHTPLEVRDPEQRCTRLQRALCAAATTTGAPGWLWVRWSTPMNPVPLDDGP